MVRVASLVVLVLAVAAPAPAHAAGRWRLAGEAPFTHKASIAAFTDEKNGMTGGYAGAMFYTHDGGKTWTAASNKSACRFGLEAVPGAAISSGNQGDVRVSDDGGERWIFATGWGRTEPAHARFLSFVDDQRGLIASPTELAMTSDGGETWIPVAPPREIGPIAAVSLAEERGALRLRLLDERGKLYLSADGGKSWTEARSPLRGGVLGSMATPFAALRFRGAEGVLAAFTAEGSSTGHVFRTRDGGQTWSEEAVPAPFPPGATTLSFDGKLLTVLGGGVARLYRAD